MKTRSRFARFIVAIATVSFVLPSAAIVLPGVVSFALAGECSAGDYDYYITSSSKDVLMTKTMIYASLAPDGSATKTLTTGTSYTGSVTVSGSATFSAGIIIAKAETTIGLQLQASGTRTDTSSFTTSITNRTSAYHRYVFFEGTRRGKGTWRSNKCVVGVMKPYATGSWGSWEAQVHGVLRCDQDATIRTAYGSDSVEYKAAVSCT